MTRTVLIADDEPNIVVSLEFLLKREGHRVLITQETPRALAKNRYGMPETIPFDWASFIAAVSEGLSRVFTTTATTRESAL